MLFMHLQPDSQHVYPQEEFIRGYRQSSELDKRGDCQHAIYPTQMLTGRMHVCQLSANYLRGTSAHLFSRT